MPWFMGIFSGTLPNPGLFSPLVSLKNGFIRGLFLGGVALGVGGCFSFGGTVQYIEESNIYLCFVVCRLKRGLVT